jgi:mono/diheme cytochrome c family protein
MGAMRVVVVGLLVAMLACGRSTGDRASGVRARTPGIKVSMDALHGMGGVPPNWKLTPPAGDVAAGRAAFVDFGCPSCHRIEGEPFAAKQSGGDAVGPELTGMGAHHPAGYFAEAIMNPDAVLIDGPGYIGPDGHSVMPDYPDMTVRQVGDIVAYLGSLKTGGAHAGHVMPAPAAIPANVSARPTPPVSPAKAYFIQSYDVKPDQLGAFEAWWRDGGRQRFLAVDGLLTVDTYVDFTRPQKPFTSMFGFRDGAALQAFTQSPSAATLGLEFDGFIGEHTHVMQFWPPMYRVSTLSAP